MWYAMVGNLSPFLAVSLEKHAKPIAELALCGLCTTKALFLFLSFFLPSFLPFLFYFPFLITGRDRTNYLLVKEAKIIAMTCTHAALKRRDLVELGFKASISSGLLMPL